MAIPSLALIPTGFKDGKLYSVLPESGAGDFDVVRGSGATRVNKDGLIELITDTNTPRLDYTDGGCPSLLLEPQSTNLVPYSEDFSQYSIGSSPIVSGGFLAPDGTNNAYKITDSGSSTVYRGGLSVSSTATRSIYARSVSGTGTATLMSYFGNTNNLFTLTEDWQRFEVNGTDAVAGEDNFYAADFRGGGTLTEYIVYGAQVEALSYATSYIPTTGVIATRLADSVTGAGDATTFNSTEGVLYAEMAALSDDGTSRRISLFQDLNNKVSLVLSPTSNSIQGLVVSGGSVQFNQTFSISNTLDFNKIAFKYKTNDFAIWVNGVEVATDTSGNTPTGLSELSFADGDNTSNVFTGKVKDVRTYNTALTDAELLTLTTI